MSDAQQDRIDREMLLSMHASFCLGLDFSFNPQNMSDLLIRTAARIDPKPRAIPAAEAKPHDVVDIDLRAVMMDQIEEAAAQSPWVPPEYAMNEVISDCCSFLREPREPSPDAAKVAALVDAAEVLLMQHDFENPMRQADYHSDICQCRRCRMDALRAAIAAMKEG